MLLLSAPRSGSTILAHALANTGKIYSASEPWILLALDQLGRTNLRSEVGSWHLAKATRDFLGPDRDRLLAMVARLIYASKLPREIEFFLDKTPRYYWIVPFVRRLFPNEKFIVLHRDPLDIAASFKTTWRVDLTGDVIVKNGETILFDLFLGVENIRKISETDLPNACFISYERLVAEPVATVAAVLRHFEIDASDSDIAKSGRVRTDAINPNHFGDQKIRQTCLVHNQSVGTWRNVLEQEEAELVAAYFNLDVAELPGAKSEVTQRRAQNLATKLNELLSLRRMQSDASYEFDVILPDVERRTRWLYGEFLSAGPR